MSEEVKKDDPIFVGNGISKFDGNLIEISVCLNDVQSHKFEYNGKHYVKLK